MRRFDRLEGDIIERTIARQEFRRKLRIAKGRPEFRTTYDQWDQGKRRIIPMGTTPDPILDLYVARENAIRHPTPYTNQRYGMIRAVVTSPVVTLP